MEFHGDIHSLIHSSVGTFSLIGSRLPTSRDAYFISKRQEIIEQYSAARLFLGETETDDWDHWFNRLDDEQFQRIAELTMKAYLYETALMYYNIVVDLSWTACYLASEFSLSQRGERVDFGGMKPVDEAYSLMRKAENLVTNPTAEENPFAYLKMMCPEFSTAIDMIVSFWEVFMQSNIRQRYNYCKHKGKPLYSEITTIADPVRLLGLYLQDDEGNQVELTSDPQDVRLHCSLEDSITELLSFDNEQLFPYISNLLSELERVINPSPFI